MDTTVPGYVLVRTVYIEGIRNSLCNQLPMKTTVLNKYLISMHARDDYTREINAVAFAFQGLRIGPRTLRLGLQRDAGSVEEREIGLVANQRKNEIVLEENFAFGRRNANRIRQNFEHA